MRSITLKIKGFQSCENHYKSSVFLDRRVSKILLTVKKKPYIATDRSKTEFKFQYIRTSYILQIQEVIRSRLLFSQSTHILINFKINSVF